MSIAKLLKVIQVAKESDLTVDVSDMDHKGDSFIRVAIFPPKVGDDYHWCYQDMFPASDLVGVTDYISKVTTEHKILNDRY